LTPGWCTRTAGSAFLRRAGPLQSPCAASSRRISAGSACWQGKPWFLRAGGRFLDRNRFRRLDASIVRYLAALDRADRDESDVAEARTTRIKDKIARLRQRMQALRAMKEKVQDAPDQQIYRYARLVKFCPLQLDSRAQ
jgi:hypothetical protein